MADGNIVAHRLMTPGVYIDLPFEDYIAVDALGSSDIKTLLRNTANWWYGSKHNKDRVEPKRPKHFARGSALHALLLEGHEVYKQQFSIEPDPRNHPDAAHTVDDIKSLLDKHKIEYKKSSSKATLIAYAAEAKLNHQVWDLITSDHKAEVDAGKQALSTLDHIGMLHMAALIENHPQIGAGLKSGIPEVSVFWHRDGEEDILLRARFDLLAAPFSVDLKTMSNWQGKDPSHAALRQIVELEYDIQATLYHEARERLREFVKNGQVFSDLEPVVPSEKLMAIAETETWNWIWLFMQLRDDTGTNPKAPVLVPRFYRPSTDKDQEAALAAGSYDMMAQANAKIQYALAQFRSYRDDVGFDTPWMHADKLYELTDEDLAAKGLIYKGVPDR